MGALNVTNVVIGATGTTVVFDVDTVGGSGTRSVCLQVNSDAGYVAVGSVGGLQIVKAVSVSPLGLSSAAAAGSMLTLSGVGLSSSDTVQLVGATAGGLLSCGNTGVTVVSAAGAGTSSVSGASLVVPLPSSVPSGVYQVCICYRGVGAVYSLIDSTQDRFSVISGSSVATTQYNFGASSIVLTVSGSGLSERDFYFGVAASGGSTSLSNAACTLVPLSGLSIAVSSVALPYGSEVFVTSSVASGVITNGFSYQLCVQPGGNPLVTQAIGVGILFSAGVVSFSPVRIPTTSGNVLTVTGSGLPVGGTVIVQVCHVYVCLAME